MRFRPAQIGVALATLLLLGATSSRPISQSRQGQPTELATLKPTPRNLRGLPGKLKLDLSSGLPIINARVGDQTLRLTVDTGASWSLLRPEAAKRLGLPLRESAELKARDAAGEVRGVEAAHVEKLVLETIVEGAGPGTPIELGDFDLIVLESPVVAGVEADGILGLPVLRRMVARFDFNGETLELGGDSLVDSDDGRTLPIRASTGGLATIEGRFVAPEAEAQTDDEAEVRNLLLDTGFSGFLHLPEKVVTELVGDEAASTQGTAATALRERKFERVPLEHDLLIGRYRLLEPVASVFTEARVTGDGSVGTALLRHFTVTLDLPRRRVRLEAPQDHVQLEEKRRLQPPGDDVPPR
jgi:predicted aspartyl protease